MSVHFNAFQFVESEKALSLFNSNGKEKGRIHLFKYDGDEHKDRYAIAAEKIEFGAGELPSLGWLDRKFYVIIEHDNTTYKVNRNSFEKRTGIKLDDYADEETGVCSDTLDTVLGDRAAELEKWNAIAVNKPNDLNGTFMKNLFQSFISAKIPSDLYQDIHFCRRVEELPPFAPLTGIKPHLVICYGVIDFEESDEADPSVRIVNIHGDEYESILDGHPASEEILTEVNYFAADLMLMKNRFNSLLAGGAPPAKLILTNTEQHIFDSEVGASMQDTVNNALNDIKEIRSAHLILQQGSNNFSIHSVKNHQATIHHCNSLASLADLVDTSLENLQTFSNW